MPPKYKSITQENLDKITEKSMDLVYPGDLASEFLPREEVYNPDGSRRIAEAWGLTLKSRMASAGFSTVRESPGNLCMLCLLGEKDEKGKQKYQIEDVMDVGRNTDVKLAEGRKIEELLAPADPALPPKQQKPSESNLEELDTLYLQGLKYVCEKLEEKLRNALEQRDFTAFLAPEMGILANLCTISLTNRLHDDCYTGGIVPKVKPGSLLDRVSAGKGEKDSLAEQVFGHGNGIREITGQYLGAANAIYNMGNQLTFFLQDVRNDERKNAISGTLPQSVIFYSMLNRYSKDKKMPLSQLASNKTTGDVMEEYLRDPRTTPEAIAPLDFAYAIHSEYGEPMSDQLKEMITEHRAPGDYKNSDIFEPFVEADRDYLCRYGAAVLAYNGELFRDLQWDVRIEKQPEEQKPELAFHGISMRKITRQDMLRAAFLTDLEPPSDGNLPKRWIGDLPPRPENQPLNSEAACTDRIQWLDQMANQMDSVRSRIRMSPEWKNLRAAMEQAKITARSMENVKNPSAEQIAKLDGSMTLLRETAARYIRHKVDTKNFDQGKDFERISLVKNIESHAKHELQQTTPYLQRTAIPEVERAGRLMSDSAIREANGKISSLIRNMITVHGSARQSREWSDMMYSADRLLQTQRQLCEKGNGFDANEDLMYYGDKEHPGVIRETMTRIDEYVQYKLAVGDGKADSAVRLELALSLKNYLQTLQQKADQNYPDRMAGYRQAAREAAEHEAAEAAQRQIAGEKQRAEAANIESFRSEALSIIEKLRKRLTKEKRMVNGKNGDPEKAEVKEVALLAPVSQEDRPEVIRQICFMYQYQRFNDAAEHVSQKKTTPEDRAVIEAVKQGRTDELITDTLKNNPGFQRLVENNLRELGNAMITPKGRRKVSEHVERINARILAQQPEGEKRQAQAGNKVQQPQGKKENETPQKQAGVPLGLG